MVLVIVIVNRIPIIISFSNLSRNPDFSLFESFKEHPDLIFSDSCMQLFQINTDIETYLGSEVIEIIHKTDPRICNKAAYLSSSSLYYLLVFILVSYLLF